MGIAKELKVKVLPRPIANKFVKANHYSGRVVNNSSVHLGVYYDGQLHGVMQFGPSFDKRKIQGLVQGTGWNEFIELNRLAFDDFLPKNSESRAIAIALRMFKKNTPHIKWVVSFADGTLCGDGTIRAKMTFTKGKHILKTQGRAGIPPGSKTLKGFQLKYVYFIDKESEKFLTVPVLPFSAIREAGAGMYKGKTRL